jgi:hypothetical protein
VLAVFGGAAQLRQEVLRLLGADRLHHQIEVHVLRHAGAARLPLLQPLPGA